MLASYSTGTRTLTLQVCRYLLDDDASIIAATCSACMKQTKKNCTMPATHVPCVAPYYVSKA